MVRLLKAYEIRKPWPALTRILAFTGLRGVGRIDVTFVYRTSSMSLLFPFCSFCRSTLSSTLLYRFLLYTILTQG